MRWLLIKKVHGIQDCSCLVGNQERRSLNQADNYSVVAW